MPDDTRITAQFTVGTTTQREALIDACEEVVRLDGSGLETEDGESEREQAGRHERLSSAVQLQEQLEDNYATVDLPLYLADRLGESVAVSIGHEMAQVEEGGPDERKGLHIRLGAEMMRTLVALDATVELQVMPVT